MRVAAFDCGTNSLRLLVADVDLAAGRLVDVERRTEIVRLGQGVDATGEITPEAMGRAFAVTAEYARSCERHGVEAVRFVATSASRDGRNAAEFVAGVHGLVGVDPEVISGAEEAHLSFTGAVRGLLAEHRPPRLVVDLGGGSTEFVLGTDDVDQALSVGVGSVRLTERYLATDPPTPDEIAAARADAIAAIDRAAGVVDVRRARSLIGVAGTVTTITAHALQLPAYDSAAVHGAALPVRQMRRACADLLRDTRAERAALPYMPLGREDVIGAGALLWDLVVERVASVAGVTQVVTSEHDILDGIAWALAEG